MPTRKDNMFQQSRRRVHPNDALRTLARNGRTPIGPTLYVHRDRPFDAFRAMFLLVAGFLLVLGGVGALPFLMAHDTITVSGIGPTASLTPDDLRAAKVYFTVKPAKNLLSLKIRVDGRVGSVAPEATRLRWVPQLELMGEGEHTVTLESGKRFLWRGPIRKTIRVTVDSVAPTVDMTVPPGPNLIAEPFEVQGTVESGSTVTVNGREVPVEDGKYAAKFATPPIGLVRVTAKDKAGNATTLEKKSNVEFPDFRAVHVSLDAWMTPALKGPILELIKTKKINAVQLDLKDESGIVSYRSALPFVRQVGANNNCAEQRCFELLDAVTELHSKGVRVIGRIVAFRDPVLGDASEKSGKFEQLVMQQDGKPYRGQKTGVFTNPASPVVQDYLLDIAEEAAKAGVDDILFDYIRRPEGKVSEFRFPGMTETESVDSVLADFLQRCAARLAVTNTRLGVSVFGIAAKNPEQIGQNVRSMARHVDYIAPMVYPSHWLSGYYNVVDPVREPFAIVDRSLADFTAQVEGTDAVIVPWLQDFSLGSKTYRADDVREQIRAARERETNGFILWDPKVTYTPGVLLADAPKVTVGSVAERRPAEPAKVQGSKK